MWCIAEGVLVHVDPSERRNPLESSRKVQELSLPPLPQSPFPESHDSIELFSPSSVVLCGRGNRDNGSS